MRLRLVFILRNKGAVLPFHHQEVVRSFLEMVLGDKYLLDSMPFNFSGLKGQTKVGREGLHYYSKRVTLVISSTKPALLEKIVEKIFALDHFYLGSLNLEPELVEKEIVEHSDEESKYLCISPLVITYNSSQLRNKIFVPPTSKEFTDLLRESTIKRMQEDKLDIPADFNASFNLLPDSTYLERIASNGKKFARIYNIKYKGQQEEIRGYTFPFRLEADQATRNFVYTNGLGEFTQYGFGMLDLANHSKAKREKVMVSNAAQK